MPSTTNFGWTTPADTDLVKDGAAAIRTLGNGIDTSFLDLKGGTTGQVLSKNSNTDLDFVWVAQDDSNAIQNAIVDAKGDIVAASAADTPARLAVGANETRLVADSAQATGLKYVADTTNYAINAKGDLLVGTAADTLTAVTVGANNTVLTADSSQASGVKWAAPAAPTFVGCAAFASANQVISNSTVTTLTFNSEKFDTNAFHDNVTNTGRFTIPANYGGYYECSLLLAFEANATGFRRVEIWKNGSKLYQTDGNGMNNGSTDTKPISAIVNLVATDYIEYRVVQNSGGNLTAYTTDQYCQASIQYLGA